MSFTEHASKKYVDERDALLATKNALKAEAEERERLANIVAQNRRDTYSKEEVNRIVDALRGARFEKVQALPELADADDRTIYLVPRGSPEAGNVYDEWIVVVDDEGARSWDKLGSTDIDLSGYATKEWVGNEFTSKDTFNREFGSLQGQINSIGTTATRAYSDAQTAKGAAYAAQSSADAAGSAAAAAQQTAEGKQDALTPEQLANIAAVPNKAERTDLDDKLDKENGVATGLVIKAGSMAFKFEAYTGTQGSLRVGTIDPTTGNIEWRGLYALSATAEPGQVATSTDISRLSARLDEADQKRLGIGNIYRLVGKTPGGAECNLVWYNMKTGSTVGNVLGFTVDGVVKTVKSVYITASPSFPDVAASVTDSNNVSYDFSGTAETLNLHEVATRGECATKRDYQDILLGTVVENWTQRGREAENAVYSWSDTYGMWVNAHNDKISGPRFVKEVSNNTYADPVTGNAPVYTFIGLDGSVLGSASAANLDLFIQEGGWQFYVGTAKTAADSLARKSEVDKEIQEAIEYAVVADDKLVPTEGPGTSVIETFQSGVTTWMSAQLPSWASNANKNIAVFRNRPVNNNYYYNCPDLLNRVVLWIGDVNKDEGQTAGYMERSLVFPKAGVYSVDVEYAVGLTYQRANAPRFLVSIGDKTQEVVGTRQIGDLQKGHLLFSVQAGSGAIRLTATPGLGVSENAAAVVIASLKVTLVKEVGVEIGDIVAPDADAQTGQAADARATYEALSGKVAADALAGETMPSVPTQNQLAEAVKKIFVALGGTIQ